MPTTHWPDYADNIAPVGTASGGRITPITDWPVYADP
jgi:hypothetical protein